MPKPTKTSLTPGEELARLWGMDLDALPPLESYKRIPPEELLGRSFVQVVPGKAPTPQETRRDPTDEELRAKWEAKLRAERGEEWWEANKQYLDGSWERVESLL